MAEELKENAGGYVTLRADSNTVGKQSLKVDLVELIKSAEFSNARETKVNGRDTISLEFRPGREM